MKSRTKSFVLALGAGMLMSLPATSLHAAVIVDDSFADGDLTKTGALDTNWWTSSSSSALEIAPGALGHVTGTSGRGIHTIFPEQTLDTVGNKLVVSYTFTTPATVGNNKSGAFKVGLFDSLGQAGLDDNVSSSSSSPNALYGYGAAVGGPGTLALPGLLMDMDINEDPLEESDLVFREHISNTITGTGRLMGTSSNFNIVDSTGPDAGYVFDPNTTYSGSLTVRRVSAGLEYTGTIGSTSYSVVDTTIDSDKFSLLGFHVNSSTFGSSNVQGEADNGIDYSNIKIEFVVPEPSSMVLILGAMTLLPGLVRRR